MSACDRAAARQKRQWSRSATFALAIGGWCSPLLFLACGDGAGPTPPATARLVIDGRTERGSTITTAVWRGTDSLAGALVRFTVQPSDAAAVASDGSIKFLREGALTLVATLPDGRTATLAVTVAVPPDIVLDMAVAGNRDLYRVAIDGGGVARLTTDPGDDSHPTVARGNVVFTTYRHGQGELYALPVAGGNERRLTTTTESEIEPALSPDGTRLAFVRPARGVAKIWVSDANAAGGQRLTADLAATSGSPESTPAWSSARQVSFTSTARGEADINLASTDALPATPTLFVASSSSADVEGSWNADGTRVAFISTRDAATPALFVANAAGETVGRVGAPAIDVSQPAWLADGRIVFVSRRANGTVLAWLDPAAPSVVHEIPVTGSSPAHPVAVR